MMSKPRVVATYNDETPNQITGIAPFDNLPKVGDTVEVYNFKTNTARLGYKVIRIRGGHYDIAIPAGEQSSFEL